jgi:ABC-2 type transport system permease protein
MRSAYHAELLKVTTVKGQWIGAILATVAMPLVSLLVVGTGRLGDGDTVTAGAAVGAIAGLLAFATWGAVFAAGEYTTGTMVVSLATVPRRSIFFLAKLSAVASVSAVGALVSSTAGFLGVLSLHPPGHHPIGNSSGLIGVVLVTLAVAVAGAAVGMIARSTTGSIVIVIAALLLPDAAGGLLGRVQPWVVGASPGAVVTRITGGVALPANQLYPAGILASVVTMLLVTAAVAAVGAVALVRRDG